MLSLDEAIKHCKEKAEKLTIKSNELYEENYEESSRCQECANEHEQLAEWLTELKELREIVEKSEKKTKFHWIHRTKDWDACSNCLLGFKGIVVDNFNFCPFCGAERDKSAETAEVENENT